MPYNPYLSMRYNAHINVEMCASIASIKYLYKYVYKGGDRAVVTIGESAADPPAAAAGPSTSAAGAAGPAGAGPAGAAGPATVNQPRHLPSLPAGAQRAAARGVQVIDEMSLYEDGRYVGSSEGSWRLLEFAMHSRVPAVVRLAIHLPDQQVVMFEDDTTADQQELQRRFRDTSSQTTLTHWFEFNATAKSEWVQQNRNRPDGAPAVPRPAVMCTLYMDMPERHVYQDKNNGWKVRQRHDHFPPVGRMYYVSPRDVERYYLRMLLCHVPGATSFENLRCTPKPDPEDPTESIVHPTFQAACVAHGLLADDHEWELCIQEAVGVSMSVPG